MVTKSEGIVERGLRIWTAHKNKVSNSSAVAEPEAEASPSGEHTFTSEEFPGYDIITSSVIRMVNDSKTLIQRVQRSSLCYMHAQAYGVFPSSIPLAVVSH